MVPWSIIGGVFPGEVILTSRLSFMRLTILGFSVGNSGKLTHGHARAVIGVDTGGNFSGRFFSDTFKSFVGGALSGWLIFISRPSFIRMTISCFTVGNRGESTHGHARDVIGVDTEVKFSSIFFNVRFNALSA